LHFCLPGFEQHIHENARDPHEHIANQQRHARQRPAPPWLTEIKDRYDAGIVAMREADGIRVGYTSQMSEDRDGKGDPSSEQS
jgi:hypothetical protein